MKRNLSRNKRVPWFSNELILNEKKEEYLSKMYIEKNRRSWRKQSLKRITCAIRSKKIEQCEKTLILQVTESNVGILKRTTKLNDI